MMNKRQLQFHPLDCKGRYPILTGKQLHKRLQNSEAFAYEFCKALCRENIDWRAILKPPDLLDENFKPVLDPEYLKAVAALKMEFSRARNTLLESHCFMQATTPDDFYGIGATKLGQLFFTFTKDAEKSLWIFDIVNRLANLKEKKSNIKPFYTWDSKRI